MKAVSCSKNDRRGERVLSEGSMLSSSKVASFLPYGYCLSCVFLYIKSIKIPLMTKKIITGVKPTGSSMHLGNLLGAVLPFKNLAKGNDAAIFIADLHALTSVKDGEKLRAQSLELAIEYLSIFGKDTPITIFRQSDIVDITKLMWVLSNVTPYSLMLRAHSYKDFEQKKFELQKEVHLLE